MANVFRPSDILSAHALLTRLPLPRADFARGGRAAWAWPLVGITTGALEAATLWLALLADLPTAVAAGLALLAGILATGALHEDGLADSADGLWGGWHRARRLEILRDSRIGSYGVIALIVSLGLRWSAIAALAGAGHLAAPLVAAAVLSRAAMVVVAARLPHARADGLSVSTGRPQPAAEAAALALAAALAMILLGQAALLALALAALGAVAVAALARARIGGQTGDILGAAQQVAQIAVLLALAATL